jgi:hypothetical protein
MRSIDLRFVSRLDKGLSLPTLWIVPPRGDCGGFYDPSRKLIVAYESEHIAGTIAHEWRHHWQDQRYQPRRYRSWSQMRSGDYCNSIVEYFKQPIEFDALLFEFRMAPSEVSEYWLSLIHKATGWPFSIFKR